MATPVYFSRRSGHFLSCMKNRAVNQEGEPIPWYSYPAVDFLRSRDHSGRSVLEFGAGYSTLFWAKQCRKVVAFEGDPRWLKELEAKIPPGAELRAISQESPGRCLQEAQEKLADGGYGKFDLVIIDGLHRERLVELSARWVSPGGAIITDNTESYGFLDAFQGIGFQRIDFFGHAPGVLLPHCTSVHFKEGCYLFDPASPVPDIVRPTSDV